MPWVEFVSDWDERLHRRQYRHHLAGSIALLRRDAATDAVNSGRAEYVQKPAHLKTDKSGKVIDAFIG